MDNNFNLDNILSLASGNVKGSQDAQKSFSDMLRDRRAFVQSSENGVGDQVQGAIQNGSNGVSISPAAAITPMLNYHTDNANTTNALTSQMFGYGQQANEGMNALTSLLGTVANQNINQQNVDLKKKELNLQYGLDDGSGMGTGAGAGNATSSNGQVIAGPNAVTEVIRQGGADILGQATDDISKRKLAQKILQSGGVGSYRKSNAYNISPGEADSLSTTNTVLSKVSRINSQINKSSALKDYLGHRVKQEFADFFNNLLGGNAGDHMVGLSSDDVATLNDLNQLNAMADQQTIGGKVSNYLANRFGNSGVGKDKTAQDNAAILKHTQDALEAQLKGYQKSKGYNDIKDIPYLDYFNNPGNAAPTGLSKQDEDLINKYKKK